MFPYSCQFKGKVLHPEGETAFLDAAGKPIAGEVGDRHFAEAVKVRERVIKWRWDTK